MIATSRMYGAQGRIIKALAHPTRLFIVDELSRGERCVCELTEMVSAEMPTVSRHPSVPRACRGEEGPLDVLRARMDELPRQRHIIVHCHTGQRSYFACRILSQHAFRMRNLSGSYRTWSAASAGNGGALEDQKKGKVV